MCPCLCGVKLSFLVALRSIHIPPLPYTISIQRSYLLNFQIGVVFRCFSLCNSSFMENKLKRKITFLVEKKSPHQKISVSQGKKHVLRMRKKTCGVEAWESLYASRSYRQSLILSNNTFRYLRSFEGTFQSILEKYH